MFSCMFSCMYVCMYVCIDVLNTSMYCSYVGFDYTYIDKHTDTDD